MPQIRAPGAGRGACSDEAGAAGKQLKARRLSFTWQMHNSQGSPGDQICPTGNSTPLSSREQPGRGPVREKGGVGRGPEEGPECPPDLQHRPARTDACTHSRRADSSEGVHSAQRLPHLESVPSKPAPGVYKAVTQTCTSIRTHTHRYTQRSHSHTHIQTRAQIHKHTLTHIYANTHSHRHTGRYTHTQTDTLRLTLTVQGVQPSLPPRGPVLGASLGHRAGGPHLSWAWAPGR